MKRLHTTLQLYRELQCLQKKIKNNNNNRGEKNRKTTAWTTFSQDKVRMEDGTEKKQTRSPHWVKNKLKDKIGAANSKRHPFKSGKHCVCKKNKKHNDLKLV